MPNTGNTQQIINYGATANDGTGDPLRTAFIKTDENFDNVWLAGPVGSNVTISNNTIQTNNTNGNITIKPNGTGIIQANASIIPNSTGTRDLGSSALSWRRAYIDELLFSDLTVTGDATIGGNLTVQGNTIQIGNITTDTLTIQLANAAVNKTAANGAGITVGANDAIATFLFNSISNTWVTNIGATVSGNITAGYFIGNGSLLTGITGSYSNANVANYLPTYSGNISAGNINVSNNVNITQDLLVKTGTFTGDATGDNSIYAGFPTFTVLGSDVVAQFSGNTDAYIQFNFQNGNTGTQASGDYVITADNGNDTTHFLNIGLTGSNWNGTQPNSLSSRIGPNDGYMYVQDGNLAIGVKDGNLTGWIWRFDITGSVTADGNLVPSANGVYSLGNSTNYWANFWVANNTIYIGGVPLGVTAGNVLTVNGNAVLQNNSNTSISTTGNITAGNLLTGGRVSATGNISGNYFIGNGSQLSGLSTSSISNGNSNVAIATANGNVTITANGTYTWSFEDTGTMNFPASPNGQIYGGLDNDFIITTANANAATYYFTFSQFGDLTVPINLNVSGNAYVSDIMGPGNGNVTVTANTQSWLFETDGRLFLPNSGVINASGNSVDIGSEDAISLEANTVVNIYTDTNGAGHQWQFGDAGELTLPASSEILEVANPGGFPGFALALVPDPNNAIDADQQLLIYPTGGVDANHLHITSGNLYNTELFLGNDDLYVKLANSGNIVVNSNDSAGNAAQWNFGINDRLTLPHGASLNDTSGDSVAFGQDAGVNNQDQHSVAIGPEAGMNNQGEDSVAIGWLAGRDDQADFSIAIGWNAGSNAQGQLAQAYGRDAGAYYQQSGALAMGYGAGRYLQKQEAIAIGSNAGYGSPQSGTVASMPSPDVVRIFGSTSTLYNGMTVVGGSIAPTTGITIVGLSGEDITLSSVPATPLTNGTNLNFYSAQGPGGVAIGSSAAQALQGQNAVAVGYRAGQTTQGTAAVAMGFRAGETTQGNSSVALGEEAGLTGQGQNSIAIGRSAGQSSQGNAAIAMGWAAAQTTQGTAAVAIGEDAGRYYQGEYSVAIGYQAGYNTQGNNSIVLNATGNQINGITANSFTVTPVRNDVANVDQVMCYNTTSKEITYGNTISVAGNISGGNLISPTLNNSGNVSVVAGGNTWTFGTNGNLTVPGPISGLGFSKLDFTTYGANSAYLTTTADDTTALFMGAVTAELYANTDVSIRANTGGTSQNWIFGQDGALTAPGNLNGVNVNTGIVSATGNISANNLSLAGNITSSIGFTGATIAINNAPGGNEGAEIQWALPSAANTVLNTSLIQDVFQNGMRFFEAGGNTRGLYMDLGNVPNGAGTAVGYRDIPQVSFTGNATLAATDAGRHYYSTLATANTLTIANNTSVSWVVGTAISIVNRGSGNITIAQGTGVSLYLAGNSSAGNRTIATYGMATLLNVAANVWMINGSQVT